MCFICKFNQFLYDHHCGKLSRHFFWLNNQKDMKYTKERFKLTIAIHHVHPALIFRSFLLHPSIFF